MHHAGAASGGSDGFAQALALIAALPLTDGEKAEAVRQLLASTKQGGKR